jgi:heat shock protein HtpX
MADSATLTPSQEVIASFSNNRFFLKWFAFASLGIIVLPTIALGKGNIGVGIFFLLLGLGGSLLALLCSKWLAKRAHRIRIIAPDAFQNDTEQHLFLCVTELASAAGLPAVPEVGVYESPDLNAFATGPSRSSSIVAVTENLLRSLPPEQLRAVVAHEVAHIANQDMLGIILMQGITNAVVLSIEAGFLLLNLGSNDHSSFLWDAMMWCVKMVLILFVSALGMLATLAYSRHREFRADAMAAALVGPGPMADALETISKDEAEIPKAQLAYAGFKIAGRPSLAEIFSTHPSVTRRIAALRG